jgi:hypothetical protein
MGNNIETYFKEIKLESIEWINPTQNEKSWWDHVNAAMII